MTPPSSAARRRMLHRRGMPSLVAFSTYLARRRLRPYQLEAGNAILDSF
jgi:hypothetical protein